MRNMLLFGLIIFSFLPGCRTTCPGPREIDNGQKSVPSAKTEEQSWSLDDVKTSPADIQIVSGTTFVCSGVHCRLLGVAESSNPAVREKALEFARRWFKSIGNHIDFSNSDQLLQLEDGTCLVWLRGHDCFLSYLNVELVRAGLVEVEYSKQKDYTFIVPTKGDDVQEDWQSLLESAKEGSRRDEKLRVLFKWP